MSRKVVRSLKAFYVLLIVLGVGSAFYIEFIVMGRSEEGLGLPIVQQYIQDGNYLPDVELVKEIINFLFNIVSTS